jgi:predicted transcriptional regulator
MAAKSNLRTSPRQTNACLERPMVFIPNQGSATRDLRLILGPLEARVMKVLWAYGECCVRDVLVRLDQRFAYTTVMTTLDRLYKKKLVNRRSQGRTYLYSAGVTCQQWIDAVARDLAGKLLVGPWPSQEVLIACLLEVVRLKKPELVGEVVRTLGNKDSELLSLGYNGA